MFKYLLALCASLVLAIGCSKPTSGTATRNNYTISIQAGDACVKQGETVHLEAAVVNIDKQARTIELRDRPVFDIEIRYENRAKSPPDDKDIPNNLFGYGRLDVWEAYQATQTK